MRALPKEYRDSEVVPASKDTQLKAAINLILTK
jgi:hypothetical protein